jgi:hypothetical protein
METSSPAADDHHFLREDRTLLWRRISSHLAGHPEDLQIALENIARWMKSGRLHPAPLLDWRERILAARESPEKFDQLIAFLAEPNHDSEPIKSCSPFVGLPLLAPSK